MVISEIALAKIVPDARTRAKHIQPATFARRVKDFYCPAMTRNGLCTQQCINCQAPILAALDGVYIDADKPLAVLAWRLRGAVAIQNEQRSKQEKSPVMTKDNMGIPITVDIISNLSAMFA